MGNPFQKEQPKPRFFEILLKSLWPDYYHTLSQHSLRQACAYFFKLWLLAFVIFGLFSLFYLIPLSSVLTTEFAKVDAFDLTLNVSVREPLHIPPSIVIANDQEYGHEFMLITATKLYHRRLICLVFRSACLYSNEPVVIGAEKFQASLQDKEQFSKELYGFILLLLPGIALTLFVVYGLKYLLLMVFGSLLIFLFTLITSYDLSIKKLVVIGVYSSTIMILGEMLTLPFINLYFLPFIVYLIVFGFAVVLVSTKKE